MTTDFRTSPGTLAVEARNLVDSRCWCSPFLYLESLRAVVAITLLEQEGDIDGARIWRTALDFNISKDREIEQLDVVEH